MLFILKFKIYLIYLAPKTRVNYSNHTSCRSVTTSQSHDMLVSGNPRYQNRISHFTFKKHASDTFLKIFLQSPLITGSPYLAGILLPNNHPVLFAKLNQLYLIVLVFQTDYLSFSLKMASLASNF